MLQKLWNYFETTGDITMYLGFKEYEEIYNHSIQMPDNQINTSKIG